MGDRPNVHPPFQFDSGLSQGETGRAVERLIEVMEGRENVEGGRWNEGELGVEGEGSEEWRWREKEGDRRGRRRDSIGEEEEVEREERQEENKFGENIELDNRIQVPLSQQLVISDNEYYEREAKQEGGDDEMRILDVGIASDRRRGNEQKEEISQEELGGDLRTKSPEPRSKHSTYASAIRSGKRRRFPQLVEDEDDDEVGRGAGRSSKKKKGGSKTLIDTVTILASAKTEGEEKKFDFLNRHLLQQADLQREELQLEREKLAIEREKAQSEQKRMEFMMLQLQASIQSNHSKQNQPLTSSESPFSHPPDSS